MIGVTFKINYLIEVHHSYYHCLTLPIMRKLLFSGENCLCLHCPLPSSFETPRIAVLAFSRPLGHDATVFGNSSHAGDSALRDIQSIELMEGGKLMN